MTAKYKLAPFQSWHVDYMNVQGLTSEGGFEGVYNDEVGAQLEKMYSFSLVHDEDGVVASAGLVEMWGGRYVAWFFGTQEAGKCMLRITRLVDAMISPIKGRIEATARADFPAANRWLKVLGFEVENPPGILKAYGPLREDHISYVRMQ